MKQGNKRKILIIAIVVVILIAVAIGVVLALTKTDFMKSNKDLFFKYASQMFDNENGFGDNRLEQYNEKQKNTVYENYGKITANISSENIDEKTLKKINDLNISFVGNIDNASNSAEELIKINYSDNVNFAFNVKKVDDSYGIKLNKVAKQYLVVEKDGISDLLSKFGIYTSLAGNIDLSGISIENFAFSKDEIDKIKDLYLNNVKNIIDEGNFSKVSTSNAEGYMVELSNSQLKDILVNILETLKTDDVMKNKINKLTGQSIDEDTISSAIDSVNEQEVEEGKTTITVYQNEGKLNKIEIQINDQVKVEFSKDSGDDNLEYNVKITTNIDNENAEVDLKMTYEGLQALEDVKQNTAITLSFGNEESSKYEYNISNEIKFIDSVEITSFGSKDSITLNKLSSERLAKILEQIGSKIEEVNKENMDEVGINGANPLIYWVPGLSSGLETLSLNQTSTQNNDQSNSSNTTVTMDEAQRQTFNSKYTKYEGDSKKGSDVKSLVMEIIAGNMAEDREIKVTGDIKIINNQMPENIDNSKTYKVECKYDDEKYINEINITEN